MGMMMFLFGLTTIGSLPQRVIFKPPFFGWFYSTDSDCVRMRFITILSNYAAQMAYLTADNLLLCSVMLSQTCGFTTHQPFEDSLSQSSNR